MDMKLTRLVKSLILFLLMLYIVIVDVRILFAGTNVFPNLLIKDLFLFLMLLIIFLQPFLFRLRETSFVKPLYDILQIPFYCFLFYNFRLCTIPLFLISIIIITQVLILVKLILYKNE